MVNGWVDGWEEMLAGYDGGGTDVMGGLFVDTNRIFFRVAATERVRYGGRRLTSSRDLLLRFYSIVRRHFSRIYIYK